MEVKIVDESSADPFSHCLPRTAVMPELQGERFVTREIAKRNGDVMKRSERQWVSVT